MNEPSFTAFPQADAGMESAHRMAAHTISDFIEQVKIGDKEQYMAKLRFIDPDLSEETGEDQILYMWLSEVYYHAEDNLLSGVFFEVPTEMQKWHEVGSRLGFEAEDVFDWMILNNGKLNGGFTLRVHRNNLNTAEEKKKYDSYIGVETYEPV